MKRIITGCLLLNFAMAAQAECNISSSIQNIDYGKLDLPLYFQTSVITYPITSPLPQIFPWRAITQRTMRMPFVIML
ncbi:hypothetical protein J4V08_23120, partial [Escherichia coli]